MELLNVMKIHHIYYQYFYNLKIKSNEIFLIDKNGKKN